MGEDQTNPSRGVLVVDDTEEIRNILTKAFVDAGYTVYAAEDGQAGIETFEEKSGEITHIICDQIMPRLNGLQMIERIKNTDRGEEVNIFMLTTETDKALRARGRELGVKFWLVKPVGVDTLIDTVKILEKGRTDRYAHLSDADSF